MAGLQRTRSPILRRHPLSAASHAGGIRVRQRRRKSATARIAAQLVRQQLRHLQRWQPVVVDDRAALEDGGGFDLRFPGGSTSDQYHWDGQYPAYAQSKGWSNWSASWAVSTAQYMKLVRQIDSIPLITANYGYAKNDTTATDGNVTNAARLAADWVEYCNAPNDGSNPNGGTDWAARRAADGSPEAYAVRYWEVGNEVFGSWETGFESNGSAYAENFNVIADAMKAVDPTIAVGLVVDPSSNGQAWTPAVLSHPGTAQRADFLIAHTYFTQFGSAAGVTVSNLFAMSKQVGDLKAALDAHVTKNTARNPAELPYYLGEYNVPGPSNSLQVSLASGLFIAKVLGELATGGWAAASLWDVLNGYDSPGTYGAGDHGFLSQGQPNVPDFTPRPTYYPFYFFTHGFGDHLLASTSSDALVSVYASSFTGGGVGLVLVNEAAEPRTASISIAGASLAGQANAWILSGPSAEGAAVTLNGIASGSAAGGSPPESVTPYTLTVSNSAVLSVDLPAWSVANLVAR
ncbi:MAG: hypothetical protein QM756_09660 [Polyangiaceae bacterium]